MHEDAEARTVVAEMLLAGFELIHDALYIAEQHSDKEARHRVILTLNDLINCIDKIERTRTVRRN